MDNLANIFARNCMIRRIDKPTASAFLMRHHRMGATGGRYRYGMFTTRSTGAAEAHLAPGTLVAVAEFSNARRWVKGSRTVSSYEWIRYASIEGFRVVGGMGKMLDHFIGEVHPDDIMSYADPDSPDGGAVYEMLGFVCEGTVDKPGFACKKYRKSIETMETAR